MATTADRDLVVRGWWLGVLVVFALLLRGIGLSGGLWIDEIYSLLNSFRPSLVHIVTVFPQDNQHPLYSVLAHLSLSLFGESAWSIRLPALLFGAATVPLLYLLGKDVATRREAWYAALILTVSYHHVWFSQNARGYSALAFFAVLSTWLLLRAVGTGRRGLWIGYAIASALGAYTHLTMVFVVVAQCAATAIALLPGSRLLERRPIGDPHFSASPWQVHSPSCCTLRSSPRCRSTSCTGLPSSRACRPRAGPSCRVFGS